MDRAGIEDAVAESIATKQRFLSECVVALDDLCRLAIGTLRRGGKLMFCGNGGSSCDAAHAAGELVGWFEKKQRPGYPAIALGHEVPTLTAIGNDAGFEFVFERQLRAIGRSDDLLVGISTSGSSRNVVRAMEAAAEMGIATAALVSTRQGPMIELADVAVRVPSENTARIQECHLLCVHVLCAAIEDALD